MLSEVAGDAVPHHADTDYANTLHPGVSVG
jgi:hypothetical protein